MRNDRPVIARLAASLAVTTVLFASMGASCSSRLGSPFGIAGPPAPVVLAPTATSADVVAAVNANASRIQTYQAQQASIALPESAGLALVSASIAVERPQRFRLRASTALTGPEVDLGSNDERFWIWARRNEPPALYTARHDQWAASPMRGQVPIEPAWIIEALGLVQLDPNAAYVGPLPRDNGTVELRTQVAGPDGVQQRVLIVDAQTAWVREQHVYNASGSLTASVYADNFRYDQTAQASLPERVRLSVPAAGLELTINTGPVVINAPISDGGQLWALPQLGAYPVVDLTTPGGVATNRSGPWDLAGVGAKYGSPEPIATQFATSSAPPAPQLARSEQATSPPTTAQSAPYSEWRPSTAPSGGQQTQPTAIVPQPVSLPEQSGFVGLPANGRSLE